jgi:hypothetical protein
VTYDLRYSTNRTDWTEVTGLQAGQFPHELKVD